jgi:hypothetical protein
MENDELREGQHTPACGHPSQEGNKNDVGAEAGADGARLRPADCAAAATGSPVSGWLEAAAEEARLLPGEHPECIERTSGDKTGKKYDTTGIRFAWLWDVLIRNVPRGLVCPGRSGEAVVQLEKSFSASMVVSLRIMSPTGSGEVLAETSAVGNHVGRERGDVLRGAETVGLKRCLANWGIGIEAYKGTLGAVRGSGSGVRGSKDDARRRPAGSAAAATSSPAEMDDRRLLMEAKKKAAAALQAEGDIVPDCFAAISCVDDRWDFVRLNKLQVSELTPMIRDLLRAMVAA